MRRRRPAPTRTDLVAVTAQLAGLAAAGVTPHRGLVHVAGLCGDDPTGRALRRAAEAAESGRPVVPELTKVSALKEVAATWAVLETTGAPVAGTLDRLSLALADDLDAARALDAGLAGPRATARILLAVPLLGLGLGYAMGADPIGVLFGGGIGFACLAVAALGTAAGFWWTRTLVAAARP